MQASELIIGPTSSEAARGKDAMDRFNIHIMNQRENINKEFINIEEFAKAAEKDVLEYLENEVGMLDYYGLNEVISEFEKSVDLIEETGVEEIHLLDNVAFHFQHLKERIHKIVQDSHKRRCPNKQAPENCGLMLQTLTDCKTCSEETIICAGGPPEVQEYFDTCSCLCIGDKCTDLKTGLSCSPCADEPAYLAMALNCGERNVGVPEDENVVLDCNIEWHATLRDSYINKFTKSEGMEPKITKDHHLNIKGTKVSDSGQYMCATTLTNGVPVSNIKYHVTVIRGSKRSRKIHRPRPTVPDGSHARKLTIPPPTPTDELDAIDPQQQYLYEEPKSDYWLIEIALPFGIIVMLIIAIWSFIAWCKRRRARQAEEKEPAKSRVSRGMEPKIILSSGLPVMSEITLQLSEDQEHP